MSVEFPGTSRLDNGLNAERFIPLLDLPAPAVAPVLDALRRARIAAFAEPGAELYRLSVAATERADARPIVRSVLRTLTPDADAPAPRDPLDGMDEATTQAAFAQLVADWQVDTVAAVRAAERDLTREDAEWRARLQLPGAGDEVNLEEEHYVPPPPPPLPRLAAATVGALVLLALSLLVLAFGGWLGLASDLTFLLGVAGILLGAGMLVMRLRARPDDEDDDGAVL